ncbi:hypothetical protein JCGZ_19055 [Jatropha curcas]|uniref:BCNT-C domain-containing protein n=1 Tax=Jatropha curcas TaxID=180498 RepID=A0A067K6S7_JATCU|nr:craniofacial development protein 1 [Jatropha curcas]XP_020538721.1 craniofacial development protein 1 [Jatropha curcas]KDP27975.1 hypothetical protein JCGZ_19055 [Jatropha curcas]
MGSQIESTQEVNSVLSSGPKPEETNMDARVQAMWEQMNKGFSNKAAIPISNKRNSSTMNASSHKSNDNWMTYLGLEPKRTEYSGQDEQQKGASGSQDGSKRVSNDTLANLSKSSLDNSSQKKSDNWMAYLGLATTKRETSAQGELQKASNSLQNPIGDEARKLAAAALSAVKDAAATAAASGRGKVEITEVRDFAGQEIEFKKLVDAESKEAAEKARATAPSAVDAVLEQIKKKPKLSVLDKTKKDWGEFKEENKGLEDELDAYKKSSNQYLDKVSFLQRTDYREFERERDARLALQARRKTDMREDDV